VSYPVTSPNHQVSPPTIKINPDYNPFDNDQKFQKKELTQREISNKENWGKLFEKEKNIPAKKEILSPNDEDKKLIQESDDIDKTNSIHPPEAYNAIQIQNRYILTHVTSGLMIIDQRRAHIKILYEEFFNLLNNNEAVSQQELFPVDISLSYSDAEILRDIIEDIRNLGFSINESESKNDCFTVTGTPSDLKNLDIKDFIEEFLEHYKKNLIDFNLDKRINLASSMAENMAIKQGKRLEKEEISTLIGKLFTCKSPESGRDGKPTLRIIKYKDIDNWFL